MDEAGAYVVIITHLNFFIIFDNCKSACEKLVVTRFDITEFSTLSCLSNIEVRLRLLIQSCFV